MTFCSRLRSIRQHGLLLDRKRNWQNAFGMKLGERGHIYLYGHLSGTVRWAHKMNYHFAKPVVILRCHVSAAVTPDDNFDANVLGPSVTTDTAIAPAAISALAVPDIALYRQVVNFRPVVDPPAWQPFHPVKAAVG